MERIASACICACEGRNGAARMRTEDGQEADGLLAAASAHLAADSAAVATGRLRDAIGRPGMPTQHRTCLDTAVASCRKLSQPMPWKSPADLSCITDRSTYPALEPGRETAVELDVRAEVGWSSLARGMRGALFVLSPSTRGLGHESCTSRPDAQSPRPWAFKTATHPAVLLVSQPRLLPACLAPNSQVTY